MGADNWQDSNFGEWCMMAGANQFTAKQFTDAIPGTGGIIAAIAKRVGCDWHTAKKYVETLPTVKQAYEDECSSIDDMAESTVIKAIRDGDVGAAKWWLEKRRRDKFADRQEIVVSGGDTAIPVTLVDYRVGITEA